MSRRIALLLVLGALAMGGYLFLVELPRERRALEEAEQSRGLLSFDPAAVDTFRIQRGDREIVLDRRRFEGVEEWWLGEEPASSSTVESQLRILSEAASARVLVDSLPADQRERYGLSVEPRLRITLEVVERSGHRHRLHVGNLTPGEGYAYVQRDDRATLELAETNVYQIAWMRPEAYWRTRLFAIEDDDVVRMEIVTPDDRWTAVRDEQGLWWWEGRPSPTRLDRDYHNGVAYDLSSAQIRAFVAVGLSEDQFTAFGLGDPFGEIRFTLRSGVRHRLRIGNEAEDNTVFARRDDEDRVLRILPQLASRLEADPSALVDTNPLARNFARLDSLRMEWPEENLRIGFRWVEDTWRADMPPAWSGDPQSLLLPMRNVLMGLERLETDDTMLLAAGHQVSDVLERTPVRVRLWWGEDAINLTLGWRGRGEHHWVQIDSEPALHRTGRDLYLTLRSFLLTTGLVDP